MAPVVKNASTARTRTPNILVVDDEPTLHELVGDIVGGTIPCKLVAAKTVDEAKKILATQKVELLVADALDRRHGDLGALRDLGQRQLDGKQDLNLVTLEQGQHLPRIDLGSLAARHGRDHGSNHGRR